MPNEQFDDYASLAISRPISLHRSHKVDLRFSVMLNEKDENRVNA
jgi:hypothetical protein